MVGNERGDIVPKQKPVVNWDDVPVLMDIPLAARVLIKSPEWVKQKAQSGELPAVKVGMEWRIPKSKLREYIGDEPTTSPEDYIKAFRAVAAEMLSLTAQLDKAIN